MQAYLARRHFQLLLFFQSPLYANFEVSIVSLWDLLGRKTGLGSRKGRFAPDNPLEPQFQFRIGRIISEMVRTQSSTYCFLDCSLLSPLSCLAHKDALYWSTLWMLSRVRAGACGGFTPLAFWDCLPWTLDEDCLRPHLMIEAPTKGERQQGT